MRTYTASKGTNILGQKYAFRRGLYGFWDLSCSCWSLRIALHGTVDNFTQINANHSMAHSLIVRVEVALKPSIFYRRLVDLLDQNGGNHLNVGVIRKENKMWLHTSKRNGKSYLKWRHRTQMAIEMKQGIFNFYLLHTVRLHNKTTSHVTYLFQSLTCHSF